MRPELDDRLGVAFRRLPGPDEHATRRARGAALAALGHPTRKRHPALRVVAAIGVVAVLLSAVAAALAASGAVTIGLHRSAPRTAERPSSRPVLPVGAQAFARLDRGSLSFVGSGGASISGLPASAVAISPHALYVAVGLGRALVVVAPNGRRAWVHPAGGRVEAIAWAPSGLRIAYLVSTRAGTALHEIEGNGANDRLLEPRVRQVRPSWRSDSLALAYVGAGGRVIVKDFARGGTEALGASCGAARAVAYAPGGQRLAAATPVGVLLFDGARARCASTGAEVEAIAWSGSRLVAALTPSGAPATSWLRVFRAEGRLSLLHSRRIGGRINALTATGELVVFGYLPVTSGGAVVAETSPALDTPDVLERLPPPPALLSVDLR